MLTPLLVIPLLGAIAIFIYPQPRLDSARRPQASRAIATIFSLIAFGWGLYLLGQFDLSTGGIQFSEFHRWIDPLGLNYSLGVDGLSLPLLVLNTLLTPIALFTGRGEKLERSRLHDSLILLINAGIAGALMAQNLLFFIIFYELELIPFYLLIAIWGGEKRGYASTKFLLYTAVSGLLVLAGFLGITFLTQAPSFEFSDVRIENLELLPKLFLLTALLVGFGIKTPLVPLHTWMPDTYVEASPSTTILLGGIFAKLGTYGLLRFGLQLFPQTWQLVAPGLAIIGTVSVMYGALTAIAQRDIKRMVAYSSIGHMGYILVAAAAGTELSVLGAIAQMIAHGIILALLFFLVGVVEQTTGTRDLDVLNGLMNPVRGLPLTSALLILAGMASAGIPGLVGFAAEFIVFQGSFSTFAIPTLLCILSSGLTAVYFVILINRTCFGKLDNTRAYYKRLTLEDQWPALVLTAIILFLGIQPNWLLRWMEPTTTSFVATLHSPAIAQIAELDNPLSIGN
ncbi:MAG: NADH-quinone oxidoreductase subunit M [Cyanobacteria bacterium SBLK]|nr:NADH-quinone oxidoreductase subunit M [Cyanobacteria bacterium SBLK]